MYDGAPLVSPSEGRRYIPGKPVRIGTATKPRRNTSNIRLRLDRSCRFYWLAAAESISVMTVTLQEFIVIVSVCIGGRSSGLGSRLNAQRHKSLKSSAVRHSI